MTEARRIGPIAAGEAADYYQDGPQIDRPSTMLDQLKADLAQEDRKEEIRIRLSSRPRAGLKLVYDPNFSFDDMELWRRGAKRKPLGGGKAEVDPLRFSAAVIVNTCTGVLKDDEEILGTDKRVLNFRHQELLAMLSTPSGGAIAAIKFFSSDAEVIAHSTAIIRAAGYDEDMEADQDPSET